MDDPTPNLDLPPVSEKSGFPWVGVLFVVALLGLAAWWMFFGKFQHQGHETAVVALNQQLDKERIALDAERQKAVEMTQQMEALKQAYKLGRVPNKKQAMADYKQLEAAHAAQVEKVKKLTAQYNEKLNKLHILQ